MSFIKTGKLNQLMTDLSDTRLVSSRWLRLHKYSNSQVSGYVSRGWLISPARGVYMRSNGRLLWEGAVRSLQIDENIPLYIGGRFALALQGYEHYLRIGEAGMITLYGPVPPPGWLGKLPIDQHFEYLGKGQFNLPLVPFSPYLSDEILSRVSLMWYSTGPGIDPLVCSTPERAILELCNTVENAAGVYEVNSLIQAMTTLRPRRISMLLRHCRSIKAKRLFLALAEHHQHAWLSHLSMEGVDLGRGKRALVPGGRLHPVYQITLPRDLDEYLV